MQLKPKNLRMLSSRGSYRLHLLLFYNILSTLSSSLYLATSKILLPCSRPSINTTLIKQATYE